MFHLIQKAIYLLLICLDQLRRLLLVEVPVTSLCLSARGGSCELQLSLLFQPRLNVPFICTEVLRQK